MDGNDHQSGIPPKRTLVCRTCGAEYPVESPNCPYCGTMNLPAAESAYMNRLENIRDDLDGLDGLAGQEGKRHLRSLRRKLLIFAAVLAVILAAALGVHLHDEREEARKEKEEYLWQRDAFAKMDGYLEAGDYASLVRYYSEAYDEGHRVYQYKHGVFCDYLMQIEYARKALSDYEKWGGAPDYLFAEELSLYSLENLQGISEEERQILEEMRAPLLEDLDQRFQLSEEELQMFRDMLKKDGYLSYSECERFLKEKGMME